VAALKQSIADAVVTFPAPGGHDATGTCTSEVEICTSEVKTCTSEVEICTSEVEIFWGAAELALMRERRCSSATAPASCDGLLAHLQALTASTPDAFVSNAGDVAMGAALVGDVLIPLSKPCDGRALYTSDSYTASTYAHYVSYVVDEIRVTATALPARLAVRGLWPAICVLLTWGLRSMLLLWMQAWAAFARLSELNTTVYINNQLLSTNLPPTLPTGRALREAMHTLTSRLATSHPAHALAFRSVDERGTPELCAALASNGYLPVPSRYVHYQPVLERSLWQRNNVVRDVKLAAKMLAAGGKGGMHVWQTLVPADLDEPTVTGVVLPRIAELYELLYVGKYSASNPQITPAYLAHAVHSGLLTVLVLIDGSSGQAWHKCPIEATLGYYLRDGKLTPPLFGYDTDAPSSRGLYRLISLKMIEEARRHGVLCHSSGGCGEFKRLRGALSTVECNYVFVAHLPWWRRLPWYALHFCLWHCIARGLKLPGGPVQPVPPLTC